jgi:hypothetical protein
VIWREEYNHDRPHSGRIFVTVRSFTTLGLDTLMAKTMMIG